MVAATLGRNGKNNNEKKNINIFLLRVRFEKKNSNSKCDVLHLHRVSFTNSDLILTYKRENDRLPSHSNNND